jgi:hypothetical protein
VWGGEGPLCGGERARCVPPSAVSHTLGRQVGVSRGPPPREAPRPWPGPARPKAGDGVGVVGARRRCRRRASKIRQASKFLRLILVLVIRAAAPCCLALAATAIQRLRAWRLIRRNPARRRCRRRASKIRQASKFLRLILVLVIRAAAPCCLALAATAIQRLRAWRLIRRNPARRRAIANISMSYIKRFITFKCEGQQ